jgi:hypothetical protein
MPCFNSINKECLVMNAVDSEQLIFLSDKNVNDSITVDELKELNVLLNVWNLDQEPKQLRIQLSKVR